MMDRMVDLILSTPRADRLVVRIMVGWLVVLVLRQMRALI